MAKKFLDSEGLGIVWRKIKTELGEKQNNLVSGTNIKSINGESLLGAGDLQVITDLSNYYNKGQVDKAVSDAKTAVKNDLVNGAAPALDTLQELAKALGDDPNFATTVSSKIGANTTAIAENARMIAAHTKNIEQATATAERGVSDAYNAQATANDSKKLAEANKDNLAILTPKVAKVEQDVSEVSSKVDTIKSDLDTKFNKKVDVTAGRNVIENTSSKINIEAKSNDTDKHIGGFVELTGASAKFGLYDSDTGGQTYYNDSYLEFKKEGHNHKIEIYKHRMSAGEIVGQKDLERYVTAISEAELNEILI